MTYARVLCVPRWVRAGQRVSACFSFCSLAIATILSDHDANVPPWRIVAHISMIPLLSVTTSVLHLSVALYALVRPPVGFQVVVKK